MKGPLNLRRPVRRTAGPSPASEASGSAPSSSQPGPRDLSTVSPKPFPDTPDPLGLAYICRSSQTPLAPAVSRQFGLAVPDGSWDLEKWGSVLRLGGGDL